MKPATHRHGANVIRNLLGIRRQSRRSGNNHRSDFIVWHAIGKTTVACVRTAHLCNHLRVVLGEGNKICIVTPTEKVSYTLTRYGCHLKNP